MREAWRVVGSIVLTLCLAVSAHAASPDEPLFNLPLEGVHAFYPGDDPAFASVAFDDGDWPTLLVPGKWSESGVSVSTYVGWYRIRFVAPDDLPAGKLALELGLISWGDETYFNGELIGGEGFFSRTSPQLRSYAPSIYRAYPIPVGLLKPGQENVIAVRVGRHFNEGGFVGGPVQITDREPALERAEQNRNQAAAVQWVLFGIDIAALIFIGAAYFGGVRGALFWSFCAMWATHFAFIFTNSQLTYELGLQSLMVSWVGILLLGVSLYLFYDFYTRALGWGRFFPMTVLATLCALIPPIVFVVRWADWPHSLSFALDLAFQATTTSTMLWSFFCAVVAWRGGVRHAWPLAMSGLVLVVAWMAVALFASTDAVLQWGGIGVEVGAKLILLGAGVSLGIHFLDQSKRLARARESVLSAQTEERGRIARDIHDNAGQSLAAINLKLQSLQAKQARGDTVDAGDLEDALSFASVASRDLRDMSHDLAPAMTADEPLEVLLRDHAQRLGEITGTQIDVVSDGPPELGPQAKDHVYRIIQEALRNAVSHGNADRIEIVLSRQGGGLKVSIQDNGSGFDEDAAMQSDGFGLTSIRERTDLVSGRVTIEAKSGEGSVVEVFVPVG
ncbi:sensor histidine kinase [Candidatus Phaeomarinobacter ectocarpi]|uniref:sensor histidine kinase n=1 Tax=Candidatus Phaeomarinibacter ectocarpi TaxID=1458461 RepID=UPI0005C75B2F|nr:sensor histidine kinase [Candidatus Phaeomarinobacter ectocarpi]